MVHVYYIFAGFVYGRPGAVVFVFCFALTFYIIQIFINLPAIFMYKADESSNMVIDILTL